MNLKRADLEGIPIFRGRPQKELLCEGAQGPARELGRARLERKVRNHALLVYKRKFAQFHVISHQPLVSSDEMQKSCPINTGGTKRGSGDVADDDDGEGSS